MLIFSRCASFLVLNPKAYWWGQKDPINSNISMNWPEVMKNTQKKLLQHYIQAPLNLIWPWSENYEAGRGGWGGTFC